MFFLSNMIKQPKTTENTQLDYMGKVIATEPAMGLYKLHTTPKGAIVPTIIKKEHTKNAIAKTRCEFQNELVTMGNQYELMQLVAATKRISTQNC